jgi:hypothetical protein
LLIDKLETPTGRYSDRQSPNQRHSDEVDVCTFFSKQINNTNDITGKRARNNNLEDCKATNLVFTSLDKHGELMHYKEVG